MSQKCPYCGYEPIELQPEQLGLNCPACEKRIIIRDGNLYTLEEAKKQADIKKTETSFEEDLQTITQTASFRTEKSGFLKIILIGLVSLFVIAGIVFAITHKESPKIQVEVTDPKPKQHKIGEYFQVGYMLYKVEKIEWKERIGGYIGINADARYLLIHFKVKNKSDENRPIPRVWVKLIDQSGASYNESDISPEVSMEKTLNPGVETEGVKVFDVPPNKKYTLEISGSSEEESKVYVRLYKEPPKKEKKEPPEASEDKNAQKKEQPETSKPLEKTKDKKRNTNSQTDLKPTSNENVIHRSIPPNPAQYQQPIYRPEPNWGAYMQAVSSKIISVWLPPSDVETSAVVITTITISRDGRVLNVSIKSSSGNEQIDQSALQAVKAASPFPPLPSEYEGNTQTIEYRFDYLGGSRIKTKKKRR